MVAPKFVERFQQTSVAEGETVVLQCRAVGTPTPLLSWQKDGVTIQNTDNVMVSYKNFHKSFPRMAGVREMQRYSTTEVYKII